MDNEINIPYGFIYIFLFEVIEHHWHGTVVEKIKIPKNKTIQQR